MDFECADPGDRVAERSYGEFMRLYPDQSESDRDEPWRTALDGPVAPGCLMAGLLDLAEAPAISRCRSIIRRTLSIRSCAEDGKDREGPLRVTLGEAVLSGRRIVELLALEEASAISR